MQGFGWGAPIPRVRKRFREVLTRRPLPHGRGSVTHAESARPEPSPGRKGGVAAAEPRNPENVSAKASRARRERSPPDALMRLAGSSTIGTVSSMRFHPAPSPESGQTKQRNITGIGGI